MPEDLYDYVKENYDKGYSLSSIKKQLLDAGHDIADIELAMAAVGPLPKDKKSFGWALWLGIGLVVAALILVLVLNGGVGDISLGGNGYDLEICDLGIRKAGPSGSDYMYHDDCIIGIAAISKDIDVCSHVEVSYMREGCYYNMASMMGDRKACAKLSDKDFKTDCITSAAMKKTDSSICDDLIETSKRGSDLDQLKEFTKNMNENYLGYSQCKKKVEEKIQILEQGEAFCDNEDLEISKTECLFIVAENQNRPDLCGESVTTIINMHRFTGESYCYNILLESDFESECAAMTDSYKKANCYGVLALEKLDPLFCDHISKSSDFDNCISPYFYTILPDASKDSSLCEYFKDNHKTVSLRLFYKQCMTVAGEGDDVRLLL